MSNEGLTERDFAILGAAFEPSEIGNNGGKPYVKARAIKKRLRMIDPNYQTDIDTYIQVIGDVVTVWGGLTLKGVRHAGSKSKNVNCWRKVPVDANDASKGQKYERVDDYEYARELANAIMKAKTGLLQRCAETFDVGDYLKEKSSPTPPSLATVLAELRKQHGAPLPTNVSPMPTTSTTTEPPPAPLPSDPPPHWALNGDGEKIKARMNQLGLKWDDLKIALEPGKALAKLSDTTLTYAEVYKKMDEINAAKVGDELDAQRKAQGQKGDEPSSVRGDELQFGDLVYGLGGSHPGRLVYKLGETEGIDFTSWAVWKNTQFTDTVSAVLFEHRLRFKVVRTGESVTLPDVVLKQIEKLKDEHASLSEGSITTLP